MQHFFQVCETAARAGGARLLALRGTAAVREKAPRDLVTEADLAAQDVIFRIIREAFPQHTVVGEERLRDEPDDAVAGFQWLIDPLDGTTNFVHGLPFYATSVALFQEGEPLVGVVFNPATNECYSAVRGQGAYLNGQRLHSSSVESVRDALIAASFAATVRPEAPEVQRFLTVLGHAQALRRMGSAALNLCFVAAGRLDGYFCSTVKSWDVAAGVLIVREAGGHVVGIDGGSFDIRRPHLIATSTPSLGEDLRHLM